MRMLVHLTMTAHQSRCPLTTIKADIVLDGETQMGISDQVHPQHVPSLGVATCDGTWEEQYIISNLRS